MNQDIDGGSGYGWQLRGLYRDGDWWGGVLTFRERGSFRTTVAITAGSHCQDCSSIAGQIVSWVRTALNKISHYQTVYDASSGIVTFAFTRSGAQGIDAVIQALQREFGNSSIPIIVSWTDRNGQLVVIICWGKRLLQALQMQLFD